MGEKIRRALFVGSFDPITRGHLDIIEKSLRVVDELIIGIGVNANKKSTLSLEDRRLILEKIFSEEERVRVVSYSGELTVHLAERLSCSCLIRGIRDSKDFEYEQTIAQMNAQLAPEITSIFLMSDPKYRHISSSLVKEIASYGEDISPMVPVEVIAILKEAMNKA